MDNEEWRSINNFPSYEVSNFGRVKSLGRIVYRKGRFGKRPYPIRERILRPCARTKRGKPTLYTVSLFTNEGKKKTVKIHQLVLDAFVGKCPPNMEGCHNDGNPYNNNLKNLRWDTRLANIADTYRHGSKRVGGYETPFQKMKGRPFVSAFLCGYGAIL